MMKNSALLSLFCGLVKFNSVLHCLEIWSVVILRDEHVCPQTNHKWLYLFCYVVIVMMKTMITHIINIWSDTMILRLGIFPFWRLESSYLKKNPFKLLSYIIIIIKSWELNGSYFIYHYHFYRDQQLWIHPAGHLITIIMTWLFGINCDHMQLNFSSKGFGMYIMSPTKNNFNCHHKFNSKTRNCPSLIGLFPAKSLVSKMNKWISSHVSVVTVH